MFFKTFSTTFIVLIFVGLSPHFVKGMRNPRGKFLYFYDF